MNTDVELSQDNTEEMLPEYDFSNGVRDRYSGRFFRCSKDMESSVGLLTRIETNPKIMMGKPVIRGTRLTVQHVLGLMANGATPDEILGEYHRLTPEDLQACLLFAAERNCPQ